jgi:hypothetical protein
MEELVKYIIGQLVNNPDDVEISSSEDKKGFVTILVKVNKNDMGRVIGKNGKIAQAIRAIVKTASNKTQTRYTVKIEEKAE